MQLMNFDGQKRLANINELYKMMDNLNTSTIKFVDGAEDVKLAWITELRYNRETKDVTFTLHPKLKKYLLNLKVFFTNYWHILN
jgi:plasmid replication initiation protein